MEKNDPLRGDGGGVNASESSKHIRLTDDARLDWLRLIRSEEPEASHRSTAASAGRTAWRSS
jgi:hypothetical protein